MSSYQKMKAKYEAEIDELRKDILGLMSDNDGESLSVKMKWQMRIAMMRTLYPKNEGNGLIDVIQKSNS